MPIVIAPIVIGRSIGAITIGMNETEVVGFYGRPRTVARQAFPGLRRTGRLAVYRLHGGTLWVIYDGAQVVGVGTSSPFYTLSGGAGPGVPLQRSPPTGLQWHPCPGAYLRTTGNRETTFVPVGRNPGARIGSVSIVARGYGAVVRCV